MTFNANGAYLSCQSNTPRVFVIQQQPLRSEPGVIGVVTLCAHVCAVADHVQGQHVEQGVAGGMHRLSEGDVGGLTGTTR